LCLLPPNSQMNVDRIGHDTIIDYFQLYGSALPRTSVFFGDVYDPTYTSSSYNAYYVAQNQRNRCFGFPRRRYYGKISACK
jgi:hypothetical protein